MSDQEAGGTADRRVLHQFGEGPWSGDEDFLAAQRRSRTITRWDLIGLIAALAAIPVGAGLFRLTGHPIPALVGFGTCLAVFVWYWFRKSWWSLTGH